MDSPWQLYVIMRKPENRKDTACHKFQLDMRTPKVYCVCSEDHLERENQACMDVCRHACLDG